MISKKLGICDDFSNEKNENDCLTKCFLFILNGFSKKKYSLYFDFKGNISDYKLIDELKLKIRKNYKLKEDEIIILQNEEEGKLIVQVIFLSDDFNNLNINEFKSKLENDKEFKNFQFIKEIKSEPIMSAFIFDQSLLDPMGNRTEFFSLLEYRGSYPYYPPFGYIGIGLNVKNKYDKGNNNWLGKVNSKDEWVFDYYFLKNAKSIKPNNIYVNSNHGHENCLDIFHRKEKIGKGIYCFLKHEQVEELSETIKIDGNEYKFILQVRVNPISIKICEHCKNNIIFLKGTTNEIRPYRFLYKKLNK